MSDFTSKHTLEDFIEKCKDNGWVTNEKEEKYFSYFYKISDEHDGAADDILNDIYDDEGRGWSQGNRLQEMSSLNNKLMNFAMSGQASFNDLDELMEISMNGPSQNELNNIKDERDKKKGINVENFQPQNNIIDVDENERYYDDESLRIDGDEGERLDNDVEELHYEFDDDSIFHDHVQIIEEDGTSYFKGSAPREPKNAPEIRKAYGMAAELVELKNLILADLTEMQLQFANTQENPLANFAEGEKPEGSTEYQNMVNQINQGIKTLSKEDLQVGELQQALKDITKKNMIYGRLKTKGIMGGPKTENGINRLNLSNDCTFRLNKYQESFDKILFDMADITEKQLGLNSDTISRMGVNDVKEYTSQYAYRNDINLPDITNEAVKNAEKIRTNNDKALLEQKLVKLTGYEPKDLESFTYSKPKNMEEAAKMYITRIYLREIKSGKATSEKLREMQNSLSGKNMERTVKELSSNKVFKDAVKNSDNFHLSYGKIEKLADEMRMDSENMLESIKTQYGGSEKEYVKDTRLHNGQNIPISGALGKNLADLYVNKLLADPKNDKLRITLASSDDLEKRFKEHVEKHFTSRILAESFKNKTALQDDKQKAMDNIIDGILNDRKNGKKILNSFADAEKAHAQKQQMYKEYNKVMQGGGPKL